MNRRTQQHSNNPVARRKKKEKERKKKDEEIIIIIIRDPETAVNNTSLVDEFVETKHCSVQPIMEIGRVTAWVDILCVI